MTLNWVALTTAQNGNDNIYYYMLEWYNPTTGLYVNQNTNTSNLLTTLTVTYPYNTQTSPYVTANAYPAGSS